MDTFKKEERLCNKRLIDGLFHNGSSFLCYPFRVTWQYATTPQPHPAQVVIAVAKKRFKHAVDRNLIKRRMREAYRLHKQIALYQALQTADKHIIMSLSYIGKEIMPFDVIEKKMLKLMQQLNEQFSR
ncbi:ribonuclease P protein component [Mucilaginibacter pallidiroseus]|uniref:Ribonuclease P protein component n=1 Tax=Mucilaginibacter pallidiroseus TaxID=2599295 RepID=A0A563UJX8_9SPHI|nr:ribonuclease P protein component [Mucilaginibacter pallidiroseus]TWR31692.1 ribonuclease P protein component [Mucilaginibacter pallidiroseus]